VAEAPIDCGGLTCKTFDTPEDAFKSIVEEKPLIIAFGETHAQQGSENVPSVTRRFTEAFLPLMKDKAAGLIVEIPIASGKCGKEKETAVQNDQKEITKTQAADDQNEFKKLGNKAVELGIAADGLHLSCADFDRLQKTKPGNDRADAWLVTIASNMGSAAKKFFEENKKKSPDKMILTYGGAIHNDLVPTPGLEEWNFGKSLDDLSGHKYVELDLIVPEFVKDAPNWQKLPWYEAFKKGGACTNDGPKRTKTIVYTLAPRSYVLVFPCN